MNGEDGFERTEAPTQRRREEAREQGQVALSGDLVTGLLLLTGSALLSWLGPAVAEGLLDGIRSHFLNTRGVDLDAEGARSLLAWEFWRGLEMVGLFLGVLFLVGVGVNLLQVGLYVNTELLGFHWDRLSPVRGWQRVFSIAALMRGLVAFLKVLVVAAVAAWVLNNRAGQITSLSTISLAAASAQGWDLVMRLALALAGALTIIGILDYVFQRYRFEQSLRMTRQELKEELKREEGDPLLKARIRRMQRETAQRRMLAEVPKATVVITNPVHLAVALRYDQKTMKAPRVIAKGRGTVAQRIIDLARRHAVPVLERKPLAHALYQLPLEGEIPAVLYHVVAELLAFVFRLRGRTWGPEVAGSPGPGAKSQTSEQ